MLLARMLKRKKRSTARNVLWFFIAGPVCVFNLTV